MKFVEKTIGIQASDVTNAVPAVKDAYTRIMSDYTLLTHPKLKMLDCLMIFCIVTFVV
jgi:hypothetical protein